ncbi:MAG: SH3 domain-containing protein [Treponema sp.]|jgi:pyruvate/2-oxoglutarate dehydrogenase complex dihydrolipoamide acyltransferase (E2) component|nr:SH3 domain-containing protein [Treponema sp.]
MYSGSSRRRFAGFCLIALFLGAISASAQFGGQVSMDTLELMTYTNFSYVPREEYGRVFKNFVKTSYGGRGSLYEYETRDFFTAFILHTRSGPFAAAWKRYEEQAEERTKVQAAEAEKARADAAARAAAEKARAEAERARAEEAARAAAAERAKYAHRLTADAKLYADQDFNAAVAASLPRGTAVQLNGYGEYTDLDGDTAKWAQVTTTAGKTGWVFSGFLEERPK